MEPEEATAETLNDLNKKVQEACTMGRPDDAMKYAEALRDAAAAYADVKRADE